MASVTDPASPAERDLLRRLAARVRQIADLPEMEQRRQRWREHNALRGQRPLVIAFPEGCWRELLPDSELQCTDPQLRGWERHLRSQIIWWEQLHDDGAIDPWFNLGPVIHIGNYGFDIPRIKTEELGSYVWDPPVKDIERDIEKLHHRTLEFDHAATERNLERAASLFGDLLPARLRGAPLWTVGLTWQIANLIGLEQLMLYMYDQPKPLHRLMAWMRDEHMHYLQWWQDQGALTIHNESEYVGSGGYAYTDELPQPDWKPGRPVRLIDRWGFGESQETVGISPAMFEEFVLPYQLPLLERFGINCYGCCEQLETRIALILKHVPRLRRVSVAPLADQRKMADALGGRYIFSRKPNPSLICVGFNEEAIRKDVRRTLEIAAGQPLELIMKDTHTVQGEPWRIGRWIRIALEEVDQFAAARV